MNRAGDHDLDSMSVEEDRQCLYVALFTGMLNFPPFLYPN